jgi:Leucine-rich repeat (LRR) protein
LHLNNNKIGQIENRTFSDLPELQILNLRANFIDELFDHSFSTLQRLEELNLGQNRIAKIQTDAFIGLQNLKILYLDDNSLHQVPASALIPLVNLAELYIGINSFTTIDNNAFAALKKLTLLNLKGAAIYNVSTNGFVGLESLRNLDLSDNRLIRIPTKELSVLTRLEELSIGQNSFEVIAEKAFEGLSNLVKIDIVGSHNLKKLLANAFEDNSNLKTIKIQSNKELSHVENAFSGLAYLQVLILKDNAIETLSIYELGDNVKLIDLSDNPLKCDCHLLWYKKYLNSITNSTKLINTLSQEENSSFPANVICAAPSYIKDKELRKVATDFLGCTPTSDPKTQAIICGLLVVSAATITAIILIVYKCRRRKFRSVLKDSGWDCSTIMRKEREYQKTYAIPQYIDNLRKVGSTSPSHSCTSHSVNNYQQYPMKSMIPTTEL